MRFPNSKYTKMRLRPGHRPGPHCGSLQHSPDPLAAGGRGSLSPPQNPTPFSVLWASSFRISALVLKEVVHPWIVRYKLTELTTLICRNDTPVNEIMIVKLCCGEHRKLSGKTESESSNNRLVFPDAVAGILCRTLTWCCRRRKTRWKRVGGDAATLTSLTITTTSLMTSLGAWWRLPKYVSSVLVWFCSK